MGLLFTMGLGFIQISHAFIIPRDMKMRFSWTCQHGNFLTDIVSFDFQLLTGGASHRVTSMKPWSSNRHHHQPSTGWAGRAIAMRGITRLNENDVLMGRGGKNNQYMGNEKLRSLARGRHKEYQTASKKGKSRISMELVETVRQMRPPGRFLRKAEDDTWEDVGDETAREKTSQVLRDAINSVKTFTSLTFDKHAITTPSLELKTASKEAMKAVTNEKSTPNRDAASLELRLRAKRPSSVDSTSTTSIRGWPDENPPSPYRPCVAPSSHQFFRRNAVFTPNHFPVPSSSLIYPPSDAKKRARYEDSPLVAGYHQQPINDGMPGFCGTTFMCGTPNLSVSFASPPNPRKQGFIYTPTQWLQQPASLSADNRPTLSASTPRYKRKYPSPTRSQLAAGQPSGESTDCWINDVPRFQQEDHAEVLLLTKASSPAQRHPLASEDFDPFNDELLSDSEHRDVSPFLFPS